MSPITFRWMVWTIAAMFILIAGGDCRVAVMGAAVLAIWDLRDRTRG